MKFFHRNKYITVLVGRELQMLRYSIERVGSKDIKPALNYNIYKKKASYNLSGYSNAIGAANTFISDMIIVCKGQNFEFIDAKRFQPLVEVEKAHSRSISTISIADYSYDISSIARNLFITSSVIDCLRCWDVRTPNMPVFRLVEHVNRHATIHASFSPCGNFIGTGSEDKQAYVYDVRKLSPVLKLSAGITDITTSLQFHPSQSKVAVSCQDGGISMFSI
ncbi:WD40-repeat-containing domain protein [Chytridium lagenaria]|nr:WD40-repeat-containing domain protein [Chytridium lagenaria]